MKLLHISDLHLGKRINDYSMIEDQKYILAKIEDIIEREKPDAILIAGDVYDRSIPSTEAIDIFDRFLCKLSDGGNQVFIISGNHDSAERLSFGSALMERSGIHIAPVYGGTMTVHANSLAAKYALQDEHGTVDIYLMPFVKPTNVRHALTATREITEDEAVLIDSYTKAMAAAIREMDIDEDHRNVLVAHQFVTGASTSDSEDIMVGGLDNVDADVFDDFDYVALGHLHGPQTLGAKANIRYCGTPLKYSFSEINHNKSVTIVELGAKTKGAGKDGAKAVAMEIREVPLRPLRDWAEVRGSFEEITSEEFLEKADRDAYTRITLLDEDDIPDAIARLKSCYPNMMVLRYDNKRTQAENDLTEGTELEKRSEIELFEELFEKQNNVVMNEAQKNRVLKLIEDIKEEMS